MSKFFYKPGRIVPKIDAQVVGEELERVLTKHGELNAPILVKESSDPSSLLHKELDLHLSNKDRATKWSEHKARNIINVITVVPENPDGSPGTTAPVQAFVNVTIGNVSEPEFRGYEPIKDILADPVKRANHIQLAIEKLMRVQREFRVLNELSAVWSAIDQTIQSMGGPTD